jgi:hypothetical protein
MRKRRWLLSAVVLVLGAGAFLAGILFWPQRDVSQECFDQLRVGMPYAEAERIIEGHGFVLGGGGVESGEATMIFKRSGCKTILIIVPRTGEVSHKELGEAPESESWVNALWQRLTGPAKK